MYFINMYNVNHMENLITNLLIIMIRKFKQ
jgi:hypothetical protein